MLYFSSLSFFNAPIRYYHCLFYKLNYRTIQKRNVFIHQVAQHLAQHSKKVGSIRYQWATTTGSPHLQLTPPPSTKKLKNGELKPAKFQVHLYFGMQSMDWIPNLIRLVPNRCNLKITKMGQDEKNVTTTTKASSSSSFSLMLFASQWYNHCLLHDARHLFEDAELSWFRDNHNHAGENSTSANGSSNNHTNNNNKYYCHPNVEATLILIQVWALQRGLWRNHDGWTKEHVALLVLYLLRTHKMNPRMTPIQLFTVVLQTWATTNWLGQAPSPTTAAAAADHSTGTIRAAQSEGAAAAEHGSSSSSSKQKRTILVLPLDGYSEVQTIQQSELAQLYQQQTKESPLTKTKEEEEGGGMEDPRTLVDAYALVRSYQLGPVFLDPSMTYNYLGGVSPNYMKLLQAQAKTSLLQHLQRQSKSSFGHLFMKPIRFWSQWDLYVQIPVEGAAKNGGEDEWETSTRRLVQILEQALGNRIYGMRVLSTGNGNLHPEVASRSGGDTNDKDQDSNQFPSVILTPQNAKTTSPTRRLSESPTGTPYIVLGLSVNPETSQRMVDRGPPAEHTQQVQSFVELWGKRAQLRRFKDGAIVQAVVWNDDSTVNNDKNSSVRFCNEDRLRAGIVERIVRHIVGLHYHSSKSSSSSSSSSTTDHTPRIQVALPNLLSILDGVAAASSSSQDKTQATIVSDPAAAHRNVMLAFDSLSDFLRKNSLPPYPGSTEKSKLGLPLAIDAVEPLSPCLRYSELFPPLPHPFLGGGGTTATKNNNKVSGVITSEPILIQIRFGPSSKWPNDLKAMGAAKTAMLIQLCNGIESLGKGGGGSGFDGPILVTPNYAELGYKGYCFRIMVRADPELRMLHGLNHPTREAAVLLQHLTRKHVLAATHHSTIHAVHTLHPSAGAVVRMAKRWVSGHLLSGLISLELIELLVAKVYDDDQDSPLGAPGTVSTGFLRFLHVLATHDWLR
jgi:U3 small nucleolar RNA-associated protein 22